MEKEPEIPPEPTLDADDNEGEPDDLEFEDHVFSIAFHPVNDIVAAGLISGDVYVYRYSVEDDNELMTSLQHHEQSCRTMTFS